MPEPPLAASPFGRVDALARRIRCVPHRGAAMALLLAAGLLPGCAATPPASWETDEERIPGQAIPEARTPRGGGFSYRLESLDTQAEGIRVDLQLHNGAGIGFRMVTLRLILIGPRGESRSARIRTGQVLPRDSRRVSAQLPLPGFPVEGLEVELISAMQLHGGYGKAAARR